MEIGVRIYATIFVAFGIRQVDVVRRTVERMLARSVGYRLIVEHVRV